MTPVRYIDTKAIAMQTVPEKKHVCNTQLGQVRSKSVQGGDLPSPRKISTTIHKLASNKDLDHHLTSMHMLWGQFIDHDISHTPFVPKVGSKARPSR